MVGASVWVAGGLPANQLATRTAISRRRVGALGGGGGGRAQHLRQGDAAQGVGDHVVDQAPVGAHAALVGDAAMALVLAALGHRQRAFHRLDDLDQADLGGVAAEAVAAVHAALAGDQARLRQRLEQLADGGLLEPGVLGQFGRAQYLALACGEHGQDHGGVVGQLGDAEHGGRVR